MPPQRSYYRVHSDWHSRPLNHEANILNPNSNNKWLLNNFGKLAERPTPQRFPENDGSILKKAICKGRKEFSGQAGGIGVSFATAAATAMQPVAVEEEVYLGRVKRVEDHQIIAEIGPPDEMDSWDVVLKREQFEKTPEQNDRIKCKISRTTTQGSTNITVNVEILDNKPRRTLEELGIEKEEWLHWAAQIDV